jgi:hypothetical protein
MPNEDSVKPFELEQEQAKPMLGMQKELLEACEQASRLA